MNIPAKLYRAQQISLSHVHKHEPLNISTSHILRYSTCVSLIVGRLMSDEWTMMADIRLLASMFIVANHIIEPTI